MASFLPPIGRSSQPYGQLPLPPGSALRFSADDLSADEQRLSNSNALMQNLETEMGRLLEWAGAGGGKAPARADEPGSAAQRREDLHAYLDARADVHQKRAKRRELTEPTGVRLPRQGRPRGRAQREVSYLSDRPRRENPANVPESMIPDAFRVLLEAPLPYAEPGFLGAFGATDEWSHNLATRKWERTVFPSKVPAGRRDVQLLHAWVGDMVARLQQTAGKLPEENMLKEAQVLFTRPSSTHHTHTATPYSIPRVTARRRQVLFSVAFHEVTRQVSVHCLERGHLMGKIWWSEMELSQLNDALTALERYEGDGGGGADSDDDGGGWAAGERDDDEGGGADDLDRSFAVLDFGDAEL